MTWQMMVALRREAEDREGWRHRERMSKPALQQKTTDDDDDDVFKIFDIIFLWPTSSKPVGTKTLRK